MRASEERLLELLLERTPEARAELERLRADAAARPGLERLEAWLGRARDAVEAPERPSPASERALVERVLARTSREDLSWRGDLRLLGGFLRERVRASRVVRAVAAALLVNLGLLPVAAVAWVLVHQPASDPRVVIRFEPAPDPAFAEPEDEAVLVPGPLELAHAAQNRLRRARYLLDPRHGAVPAPVEPPASAGDPAALRLLDLRSRFLFGDAWPAWLAGPRFDVEDEVALALYVELCLDRFARDGERAPGLDDALDRLRAGGTAGLAREALDRAGAYGLLDEPVRRERRDPVDAEWRAALAEALGEMARDPRASAWVASD